MDIKFSFEDQEYLAGSDFYDKDRVVLPDRRILDVEDGWSEKLPPAPCRLIQVGTGNNSVSVEVIAELWHAAVGRRA
ncbi:MAG: hypothetical protein Q7R79_02290 [bacterium]|nr:hypothetical protein [bacterium]